jgi:hypothetical protein
MSVRGKGKGERERTDEIAEEGGRRKEKVEGGTRNEGTGTRKECGGEGVTGR